MQKNKYFVQIIALAMVFVFMASGVAEAYSLGSRTLARGARGDDVAELQAFLNSNGFDSGPVDGIFGPLTYGGVVKFQRANGLVEDGTVGKETVGAIMEAREEKKEKEEPVAAKAELKAAANEFNFTQAELDLFARLVHAEAAGEPYEGQVAVAASVLNRVRSSLYPNTLPGVINQVTNGYYQYSPVLDGRIKSPAGESARKAVQDALNGQDPSAGATGFYNPRKTSNRWVRSRPVTRTIGQHVFFK